MAAVISFNPMVTTNAPGSFNISSDGHISGTAYDDPATRFALAGGALAATETLPMWGGVAISEAIPIVPPYAPAQITRAAGLSTMTGLSVFDQDHSMFNTPQSQVPVAGSGMSVHFYRFNSGARIAVPVDPALVSLEGSIITSPVSWDFGGQQLAPYQASYNADAITAASWSNTNGGQATYTTTSAHGLSVGSDITISGMTPAVYNGNFKTLAGTTGSTIVVSLPLASTPGAGTAFGQLNAGGGALPCKVLEVAIGNSMVPVYNATTGFVTWNRSGSTAIIQI